MEALIVPTLNQIYLTMELEVFLFKSTNHKHRSQLSKINAVWDTICEQMCIVRPNWKTELITKQQLFSQDAQDVELKSPRLASFGVVARVATSDCAITAVLVDHD